LREGKRERLVRTHAAEGAPFDYGRFEIITEPWPEAELARMIAGRSGGSSVDDAPPKNHEGRTAP
jgi:hypothetical protein